MSATHFAGPVISTAGFGVSDTVNGIIDGSGNIALPVAAAFNRGVPGAAGVYETILKQITGIVEATATDVLTITVPNVSGGAGGRIMVVSTLTQASHIGDSTRTIEYLWAVTRLAGAIAVITITVITGGAVIATKAGGYTFTSVLAASAVTGGATAVNTFTFQITNDASTDSTSTATVFAECLNSLAGGVTIA